MWSAVQDAHDSANGRLSDANRRTLEFLSLHPAATAEQLSVRLRADNATAIRCLRELDQLGAVRSRRWSPGGSARWQITPAGLHAIDSPLPAPGFSLGDEHELAVVWRWLAAIEGALGELDRVFSAPEMHALDQQADHDHLALIAERDAPPFGIRPAHPDGADAGLCYPDLMLILAQGRISVHLQLHAPDSDRLPALIRGYGADERVCVVLYLVADMRIGTMIEQAAAEAELSALVHVQTAT